MLGTLLASTPDLDPLIHPFVILLLCVGAGIGTLLLLPGRRQAPKLGGALAAIMLILLGLLAVRGANGAVATGTGPYFWIFAAIAIFGAIRVITHARPVYSALYFILTVFASAGLFILCYAEFMAAALVLIYAGAILITYVFVIMLAASAQSTSASPLANLAECDVTSREPFSAACIGFALMGVLVFVIFDKAQALPVPVPAVSALPTNLSAVYVSDQQVHGSTQSIGQYLFVDQMVNLELAGLILTLSMVGAIVIARRRVGVEDGAEPPSDTITSGPTYVNDDPHSIPVYGTVDPKQKAFPET